MADGPPFKLAQEGSRLARNSALLSAGSLVGLALGFVSTILITDGLGDDYGLLIGAQRFVRLFLMLASFGLSPLLVRALAAGRHDPGELLANVLLVRAVTGTVFAGLVPVAAWATGYLPEATWLLLAFVVIEFLNVLADSYVAICEGFERMGRSALILLSRSLVTFGGVIGVSLYGGGLAAFAMVYLASQVVQLGVAVVLARGATPHLVLRPRLAALPPLLAEAARFVGVGLTASALGSVAVLGLARLAVPAETARYGAALNFIEMVLMLPLLVQRVLLPAFSRLSVSGGAREVASHSLGILSLLMFPAGMGLAALADPILAIYPSGGFADSAPVLRVLALWLFFLAPNFVTASFLTGMGRLGTLTAVNGLGIVLQAALLLVAVPRGGAVGAAGAAAVALGFVAAVQLVVCRAAGVGIPWWVLVRALACSLAMGAALWPLRDLPLAATLPLGVLLYGGLLLLLAPRDGIERRLLQEGRALWPRR